MPNFQFELESLVIYIIWSAYRVDIGVYLFHLETQRVFAKFFEAECGGSVDNKGLETKVSLV